VIDKNADEGQSAKKIETQVALWGGGGFHMLNAAVI